MWDSKSHFERSESSKLSRPIINAKVVPILKMIRDFIQLAFYGAVAQLELEQLSSKQQVGSSSLSSIT